MTSIALAVAVLAAADGAGATREAAGGGAPTTVSSPDGRLRVGFSLEGGVPRYTVERDGRPLILPSRLGFSFRGAPPLTGDFELADSATRSFDETWKPVWGKCSSVRNHGNELAVSLRERKAPGRELAVVFRVFDDAVAFRYVLPGQPGLGEFEILSEETRFCFADDHTTWWIPNDYDSDEFLWNETPLSSVPGANTPVTMRAADGTHLCVHEAALVDYASMTLEPDPDEGPLTLRSVLVPWPDGVAVRGRTPFVTPWRVILVTDRAGGLVESNTILNLNEPCALEDTSWIRPMKYVGIWWGMHIKRNTWHAGPTHGATTANARKAIDFAHEHGIPGVLIEGWNTGWERWGSEGTFDFVTPYPDFDLESVARYARQRGVALIGHHETGGDVPTYERMMEEAFALYERLGVHAVKTGYAGGIFPRGQHHYGQWMVNHYRRVIALAAAHRIAIDGHEVVKPTGEERTWPNMMTREAARGMEYNAWSEGNPPPHTTVLPFTRIVAGPLDYTPGIFDIQFDRTMGRSAKTTLAHQLALYVVLWSPLQMAADLVENYEGQPAFAFIEAVPCDWDETVGLDCAIGDYATIARRSGREWFLGSVTDENARTLSVPLAFLEPGAVYRARIYADGPGADWETNPTSIAIREVEVTAGDVLAVALAPGGGQAVQLTPVR
jgi:alpha-glucosidase